jgi:hypothetical protein
MPEEFSEQAKADFSRARWKAFLNQIGALLQGRSDHNQLLSFDEVKEALHIGGPVYRGVKTIRVDQIIGSLNRYSDFDHAFLPAHSASADRWQSVARAFYQDISLPPVVLYKVGQVYFVVDGHHRVSVAREQGQVFIDAEVRECATKVNITADIKPEDLEMLGDKVDFIERTQIDHLRPEANIKLTIPDGFERIIEHIAVHRYFMGIDFKRDISEDEAVIHWYDTVYEPVAQIIRASGILEEFPGKTEGDLYLWVLDRQAELAKEGQGLQAPDQAARDFVEEQD